MAAEKMIIPRYPGARVTGTDGNDRRADEGSIHSQGISRRIKLNIKQEWERQKRFHGRTQEELAAYLNISQGAVSKLLNNRTGHPWDVDKIELFARFCDVAIADLVGDAELAGAVAGRRAEVGFATVRQIGQAKAALRRFIEDHGAALDDATLQRLAGRLAARVEHTDRSDQTYNREIMKLLISEAAGPWGSLL